MNKEIEFKFLVKNNNWRDSIISSTFIRQGYLLDDCTEQMIRIRLTNNSAKLCIKYPTDKDHIRIEYEYEIPLPNGKDIFKRTQHKLIKIRHIVEWNDYTFEVDEFLEDNAGLIIAEFETENPHLLTIYENNDNLFEEIDWLGDNVTSNISLLNCNLAITPFNLLPKK